MTTTLHPLPTRALPLERAPSLSEREHASDGLGARSGPSKEADGSDDRFYDSLRERTLRGVEAVVRQDRIYPGLLDEPITRLAARCERKGCSHIGASHTAGESGTGCRFCVCSRLVEERQ